MIRRAITILAIACLPAVPATAEQAALSADDQAIITALQILVDNPAVDTEQVIAFAMQAFPQLSLTAILDLTTGSTLPDYAGPTGFEVDAFADPTAPTLAMPELSLGQVVEILAIASARSEIFDESEALAQAIVAAGVTRMPSAIRWSPLGMEWHDAIQARDYTAITDIARRIAAADKRRQAIRARARGE